MWIKGQPDSPGYYWIFSKRITSLVYISDSMAAFFCDDTWDIEGWSLGGLFNKINEYTHYLKIETPEGPK